MILVWFIYGLAFFVLGLVILVYPRRGSRFDLARHIGMIGAFGILHGINEWLDMFIDIGGPLPPDLMAEARLFTLSGSFFFLVLFGTTVACRKLKGCPLLRWVPVLLTAAWLAILLSRQPHERLLMGDIWARYLLGAPGAFLTALALLSQRPQFRAMGLRSITRNLAIAGVTFLVYSVLAGLFVRKAGFFPASILNYEVFIALTGFPVQIMRAVCAVVMAWSLIRILDVFRWETREALRISELRCATVASAMPVFLFMIDRDLVVTFIQGRGLDVLGVRPEQALGRRLSEVFPSNEGFVESCRHVLAGQELVAVDHLGGVPFEIYYSPLKDRAGTVASVAGVALDISSQVEARRELEEYRHGMEKRAREAAVGALSAMMGRQVAEPLSVAQLVLERVVAEMAGSDWPDEARTGVRKGLSEVSKALDTLGRFLDIAHANSGVTKRPLGLYQIAKRTVSVFADSAQRKRLVIAVRDIDIVPLMGVSSREMEQIFYHLIQRAVDAAGGQQPQKLVIGGSASAGQLELVFSDTCGADQPQQPEHPFSPILSDSAGIGSGELGLAVVQQIVAEHAGEITMEVLPDGTTIIRVRLPVERVY